MTVPVINRYESGYGNHQEVSWCFHHHLQYVRSGHDSPPIREHVLNPPVNRKPMSDLLEIKARLVLGGDVSIPEGFSHPHIDMRDGEPHSMVLGFQGIMVRKKVSRDGQFALCDDGGVLSLREGDELLSDHVSIVPMFGHSPETVTVTISKGGKEMSVEEALAIMDSYSGMEVIRGVTINGNRADPRHYADVVSAYSSRYDHPIGVGSNDMDPQVVRMLREAGAVNMKVGITDVHDVDEGFWLRLSDTVGVFGKGMVTCSLFVTDDVSDDELLDVIDRMCSIGAMPDVKVRRSEETGLKEATPERYCYIQRSMKSIMERYGLDGSGFDTMCYGCRLCMIVPFKDF